MWKLKVRVPVPRARNRLNLLLFFELILMRRLVLGVDDTFANLTFVTPMAVVGQPQILCVNH